MSGKEGRGRFSASVRALQVDVTFKNGNKQTFTGDDAHTFGIAISNRQHSLSVYDLLKQECERKQVPIIKLAGDKALSQASHFGEATVDYTSRNKLDDAADASQAHAHLVPEYLDIRYQIVIRREADG